LLDRCASSEDCDLSGRRAKRYRSTSRTSTCVGLSRLSNPGCRKALLAWVYDLILGLPPTDVSPVRRRYSSVTARHLPAPRRPRPRPPAFGPKQSANAGTAGRPIAAGPIFAVRSDLYASAPITMSSLPRSGASHEVFSPSAHTDRDALSGAELILFAGLRTIPLRRFDFRQPARPYSRTVLTNHRPCGFSPSAEQSGVARTGGQAG